jgi:hypothetical protein
VLKLHRPEEAAYDIKPRLQSLVQVGGQVVAEEQQQRDDSTWASVVAIWGARDSSILWHAAEETGDSRSFDAGGRKTDTHTPILLKVKRGVGGVWACVRPWVRCGGCV